MVADQLNSTPLPANLGKAKKRSHFGVFLSLFSLFFILVGLVGFLVVLRKPIKPKVPAAYQATKVCNGEPGERKGTVIISHKFNSIEDCVSCRDGDCNPAQLVGQPTDCGGGQVCTPGSPASCVIGQGQNSCTFSLTVPDCSVYQIDCGNGEWPSLGNISGGIEWNCSGSCGGTQPSATPTLAPSPTPTSALSPTPTLTPTVTLTPSPTMTPSPTPTATPGPSNTPTPGPSATPIPVGCGTKGCDNSTNPCRSGLTCVQANDGSNYCSMPEFVNACKSSPSQTSCCTAPATSSTPAPTTVAVKTTEIPSVGVAKFGAIFGAISFGIILLGLIF